MTDILDRNTTTKTISDRLHKALDEAPDMDEKTALAQQSHILDLAFRHILFKGTDPANTSMERVLVALKAQNQYRQTQTLVNNLKNNKSGSAQPSKT